MEPTSNDLKPNEIRSKLALKGITQAAIARTLGCTPSAVGKVINGLSTSDAIRRALAQAIDMDVAQVWPSVYLNGGPRTPGRPTSPDYHNPAN